MISSVPISIYIARGGAGSLAHVEGILRMEGEDLVLEFRTVFGRVVTVKSRPKEIHIPLKYVDALEYKSSFFPFRAKLRLRVRNLEQLAAVPGSRGAEITLRCKRRYRSLAHELANLVAFRLLSGVFTEEGRLPGA